MEEKSDVILFAERNANDTELLENGKLRFRLTGMEFSPTTPHALLQAHANGRAMKRAKNQDHDYSVYLPHVVPHKAKDSSFFLYCKLTNTTIPKIPGKVQNHVNGKRFRAKLAQWQAKEKQRKERSDAVAKRRTKRPETDGEGPGDGSESEEDDVLDAISLTDDSESGDQSGELSDAEIDAQSLSEDENAIEDVPDPKNENVSSESEDGMDLDGGTEGSNGVPRTGTDQKRRVSGGKNTRKLRVASTRKNSPRVSTGKRTRIDRKVPKKVAHVRRRPRARTGMAGAT